MRVDAIRDLFEPAGPVDVRRMFGGHGIFRDGRMVAIEAMGGLWMKADERTRPAFESAGSRPFTYSRSNGAVIALSYWSLPEEALDDPDAMRDWIRLAESAAARAAALAPPKRPRRTT